MVAASPDGDRDDRFFVPFLATNFGSVRTDPGAVAVAALLGLGDRYAVIRQQVATALPLLAVNIALLYGFGFR